MSEPPSHDVVILGSGQGGKHLAWHLAGSGKKVAVVERQWVGGSCPAVACLPSKNELWSARIAHLVRNAAQFGTTADNVKTDMAQIRRRKQAMIDRGIEAHLAAYKNSGAELIMGSGRFTAPKTLEVTLNDGGTRTLTGGQVVLNLGTHAAIPDIPGIRDTRPLTHIEALELDTAPEHLIVLGGGYTGIEMAQAFRRFGSRVTVIEPGPRIMAREDPEIAGEMARLLRADGIDILLDTRPLRAGGASGRSVSITVRTEAAEQKIEASHLLVAVGRIPNTAGIGLDQAGIDLTPTGLVRVDARLQTTAPGVWALGECAGSPQFTHVSVDDYRIIRDNMAGGDRKTTDRLIPHVVFTDPPLARVGLSETEAQRQGVPVRVARLPMRRILRTEATDETEGFLKALVGAHDDRILGFAMIGSEAGEVMAAIQTAMLAGLPYPRLRDAVFAHLTIAEGLGPLFESMPPGPA